MNKVIFGSGLIGLLAKEILGPEWKIITFNKSRFFSFKSPLDDNYISQDNAIDKYIAKLSPQGITNHIYRRAFSIGGQLVTTYNDDLLHDWLSKVFGINYPSHAPIYYKHRMSFPIYNIRANALYESLIAKYEKELQTKSKLLSIGDHYYITSENGNQTKHDFDIAISTIPLNILLDYLGKQHNLQTKPCYYVRIMTNSLDFEGNNQVFDCNKQFSFYKCTNTAKNEYTFYMHEEVAMPGMYFRAFINDFTILDGTCIKDAIILGDRPNIDLSQYGIDCIGSYAQWDYCADIGSCILRIVKYLNNNGN